ncbi:hypothetical protein EZV62_024171 [Acer yangbiense]|uniref:UspA domain-containing protein n=1 Tax=Acer yangbiense TaxID=1000413 RepID=A0A5C7H402_9ROSI|nr:hypothetical protein EZV62_024171 [Acer yangbiense]
MARSHTRSPRLSISKSVARVRVHSPTLQQQRRKASASSVETDQTVEFLCNGEEIDYGDEGSGKLEGGGGNKVMVAVDSSLDAKGALEWALTHTLQNQDTILLVSIANSSKLGKEYNKKLKLRSYEKLHSMKSTCEMTRPGVQVELVMLEGKEKEKGAMIVEEAKKQKVSLLVLGQKKKKSILWRLMKRWSSKTTTAGCIVNHCIQNASCMTIAVRRKSTQLGGYLITTKRHKKFWLLA